MISRRTRGKEERGEGEERTDVRVVDVSSSSFQFCLSSISSVGNLEMKEGNENEVSEEEGKERRGEKKETKRGERD